MYVLHVVCDIHVYVVSQWDWKNKSITIATRTRVLRTAQTRTKRYESDSQLVGGGGVRGWVRGVRIRRETNKSEKYANMKTTHYH